MTGNAYGSVAKATASYPDGRDIPGFGLLLHLVTMPGSYVEEEGLLRGQE